ncbi:hypothetical protein niasHT_030984 [Heterodera trifolii]|uniref:Uncharacterized protein n=1 Tax=Heterodera trifolii TaxID=157864 RepID=A0ABD2HRV1_9BILA
MTFLTDILHPNGGKSGWRNNSSNPFPFFQLTGVARVCISILHPPGNDPLGYEQTSEVGPTAAGGAELQQSCQCGCYHFVPQRPGTIQGGSATARGAGISIDTASEVNTTTGRATVGSTAAGDAATTAGRTGDAPPEGQHQGTPQRQQHRHKGKKRRSSNNNNKRANGTFDVT